MEQPDAPPSGAGAGVVEETTSREDGEHAKLNGDGAPGATAGGGQDDAGEEGEEEEAEEDEDEDEMTEERVTFMVTRPPI